MPSLLRRMSDLGIGFKDLNTRQSSLEDIFVSLVHQKGRGMNSTYGTWAIYRFEMARALRTLWQSLVTPVITTSLYFVVFGAAIGGNIRADATGGVPYGAFIVPGPDHALAVHAEHLQRQLRHLLPEVHRHDLRIALGADLAAGDGDRLCRRGGDQVDRARPRHPRHRRLLRADPDRPSRSG